MATSYNGWAASPNPAAIDIDTAWSVLGSRPFASGGFPGGVKSGPVATVFRHLVTRLHNEVEPMMTDPTSGQIGYGCWGYGYRANVNNPSVLSCHASGTAIDYNAPRHPNGTSVGRNGGGGWTAEQAAKIRGILADLGGVVRWLSGNDPMHFEINASADAVARVAVGLGAPGKPNNPPPVDPEEMFLVALTEDQQEEAKKLVHDAMIWFFQEGEGAGIDALLLRREVAKAVRELDIPGVVAGAVRTQLAKLLPSAIKADKDEFQAAKEIIHDGSKWALEDPNVDVSRFRG